MLWYWIIPIVYLNSLAFANEKFLFEGEFTNDSLPLNSLLGYSVSVDGNTAVIGAPSSCPQGSVFIYTQDNSLNWKQTQHIIPYLLNPGSNFGTSVSISGNFLLIGASGVWKSSYGYGAAYMYAKQGSNWIYQQELIPNSTSPSTKWFGSHVVLDGYTAMVTPSGGISVFMYSPMSALWTFRQTILNFNEDLAMDVCGTTIISGGRRIISQQVMQVFHVLVWNSSATMWVEEAMIPFPFELGTISEVSCSGNVLMIGGLNSWYNNGSVYVYTRTDGRWNMRTNLEPALGWNRRSFGEHIVVKGNVSIIAGEGEIYVFRRNMSAWCQEQHIVLPNNSNVWLNDIDLSTNGRVMVVGAPNLVTVSKALGVGTAYIWGSSNTNISGQSPKWCSLLFHTRSPSLRPTSRYWTLRPTPSPATSSPSMSSHHIKGGTAGRPTRSNSQKAFVIIIAVVITLCFCVVGIWAFRRKRTSERSSVEDYVMLQKPEQLQLESQIANTTNE